MKNRINPVPFRKNGSIRWAAVLALAMCLTLVLTLSAAAFADGEPESGAGAPDPGGATFDSHVVVGVETITDSDGTATPGNPADDPIHFENIAEEPQQPEGGEGGGGEPQQAENPDEAPNCIQQAVDAAIEKLTNDSDSVNITVEAGFYTGDIHINTDKLSEGVTLKDDFTLIIRSESSGTAAQPQTAGNEVQFGGNIAIDNLNVSLIGIYLTLQSVIEARNSDVTIVGTAEDDGVNVVLGENATATIDTGDGDDTISVSTATGTEDAGDVTIHTGSGHDSVNAAVAAPNMDLVIDGHDITLNGEISAQSVTVTANDSDAPVSVASNGSRTQTATASIVVNADITTTGDVTLTATNELSDTVAGSEQAVSSISSRARVTVNGKINAGGTLTVTSTSNVSVTTDASGRAMSVIQNRSQVNVGPAAVLRGAQGVRVNAGGKTYVKAKADAGFAVAVSDQSVDANAAAGSRIESDRDVEVSTSAQSVSEAKANSDGASSQSVSQLAQAAAADTLSDIGALLTGSGASEGFEALGLSGAATEADVTGSYSMIAANVARSGSSAALLGEVAAAGSVKLNACGTTTSTATSPNGLAIAMSGNDNAATLGGSVTAKNVLIEAGSGVSGNDTILTARAAGLDAVQLAEVRNVAEIAENAELDLTGTLTLNAEATETVEANARRRSVQISGVDVLSQIGEDTRINDPTTAFESLSVTSKNTFTGTVNSALRTGLMAGGVKVAAEVGTGNALKLNKNATVLAESETLRTNAVTSASLLGSTSGTSSAVSVLNDSTSSNLNRGVTTTGTVKVNSTSRDRANHSSGTVLAVPGDAGDSGDSHPSDGEDHLLTAAKKLSKAVATGNLNPNALTALTADRQLVETVEGSVTNHGALAYALVSHSNHAHLGDSSHAVNAGSIEVLALAETDSLVVADRSAHRSGNGYGSAAAVNQVKYRNEAEIIGSDMQGSSLTVKADMLTNQTNEFGALAKPGTGENEKVSRVGALAINYVDGSTRAEVLDREEFGCESSINGAVTVTANVSQNDMVNAEAAKSGFIGKGGAFALNDATAGALAAIGQNNHFNAGSVTVDAASNHNLTTNSVSGEIIEKKNAFDISVAFTYAGDQVKAIIGKLSGLTVSDNVTVKALTQGGSTTEAKTFTAVFNNDELKDSGTVVAVSLLETRAWAEMDANAVIGGDLVVEAKNTATDTARAINSRSGGDAYDKFQYQSGDAIMATATRLNTYLLRHAYTEFRNSQGEKVYSHSGGVFTALATGGDVIDQAEEDQESIEEIVELVMGNLKKKPLSTSVMLSQNAHTFGLEQATLITVALHEALDGKLTIDADIAGFDLSKLDFGEMILDTIVTIFGGKVVTDAAGIASQILAREAVAQVAGVVTAKSATVNAENTTSFGAIADGINYRYETGWAAMSVTGRQGSVALVNLENTALAAVTDTLTLTGGDLSITAKLSQNKTSSDVFKYTALAVPGGTPYNGFEATSGISFSNAIGLAVVVIADRSEVFSLLDGSVINGGDITVSAEEDCALSARAGDYYRDMNGKVDGTAGLGGSHAYIFSRAAVHALVGKDAAEVNGTNLVVEAYKHGGDDVPYLNPLNYNGEEKLISSEGSGKDHYMILNSSYILDRSGSNSAKLTDPTRTVQVGYREVKMYLEDILIGSTYYVSAVNGSTGGGFTNDGGSEVMLYLYHWVEAEIDEGVVVNLTGSADVTATVTANVALLAGATQPSEFDAVGSGGVMDVFTSGAAARAIISGTVNAAGDLTVKATSVNNIFQYNNAVPPVRIPQFAGWNMSDTVSIVVFADETKALITSTAHVVAASVLVEANRRAIADIVNTTPENYFPSLGFANTVAGGSIFFGFDWSRVYASIASGNKYNEDGSVMKDESGNDIFHAATVKALTGDVKVLAKSHAKSTGIFESMAIGVSLDGSQMAANLGALIALTEVGASIGEKVEVEAAGNVEVLASSSTVYQNLSEGKAVGSDAKGWSLLLDVFWRTTLAEIGANAVVKAGRDIIVKASADEFSLLYGIALAISFEGSLNICLNVVVSDNKVRTLVNAGAQLLAEGSILVDAELRNEQFIVGGLAAISADGTKGVVVGVTVASNNVTTRVEDGTVLIARGKTELSDSFLEHFPADGSAGAPTKGVHVHAHGCEVVWQAGVAAASALGITAGGEGDDSSSLKTKIKGFTAKYGSKLALAIFANNLSPNLRGQIAEGLGFYFGGGIVTSANFFASKTEVTKLTMKQRMARERANNLRHGRLDTDDGHGNKPREFKNNKGGNKSTKTQQQKDKQNQANSPKKPKEAEGGMAGVLSVVVMENNVRAFLKGTAVAGFESLNAADPCAAACDVKLIAFDEASQHAGVGTLSGNGQGSAKGFGISTIVYRKDVVADAGDAEAIKASGNVEVKAVNHDWIDMLVAAVAATAKGGAVAGDISALVMGNATTAMLGGTVDALGDIIVAATTSNEIHCLGLGGAVSLTGGGKTAVVIVVYFSSETVAYVEDNAVLNAGGSILLSALSKEDISPEGIGAAVGGKNATIGGTAEVMITSVIVEAFTGDNVTLNAGADVTVQAQDIYTLVAAATVLTASGNTSVGVAAVVNVLSNGVMALLGTNGHVTAGTGNVTVQSNSERTIDNYVASAAGGSTGVAPAISVVVAGGKLPEDAANGMKESNINIGHNVNTAFNNASEIARDENGNFIKDENGNYVYVSVAEVDTDSDNNGELTCLASDGQTAESVKPDSVNGDQSGWNAFGQDTGSDFGAGAAEVNYSKDSENPNVNDVDSDPTNGFDGSEAANLSYGDNSYSVNCDAAASLVCAGTSINAGGNIDVLANDLLKSDLIAGSIAAGKTGISVGIAVGILNSNVDALVSGDTTLTAGGNVNVKASTGSAERTIDSTPVDADGTLGGEATRNRQLVSDKIRTDGICSDDSSTVRVISVTVSAGGTAASAAVAVLLVHSAVSAELNGTVTAAGDVSVEGSMNFGQVVSATLAIAAGSTGLGGSVAFTYFNGSVNTGIGDSAVIRAKNVGVKTVGITNVIDVAVALAAGGTGVAAGVALGFNRSTANTYIKRGATVEATGTGASSGVVSVTAEFESAATAFVAFLAAGSMAIGASVALVMNGLEANTFIGYKPGDTATESVGSVTAKTVVVRNILTGEASVYGAGLSAGAISGNGIVALNFNKVKSVSAINGVNLTANNATVDAQLVGDAVVAIASISAGGVAVGATVGIAIVSANSLNLVNAEGGEINIAGTLTIGKRSVASKAILYMATGTFGATSVGVNIGLAINNAVFTTKLTGKASGKLTAGTVDMNMNGNAAANIVIGNASAGSVAIAASVGIVILKTVQEAIVDSAAEMQINALNVACTQNTTDYLVDQYTLDLGDLGKQTIKFNKMAEVIIISGQGAAIGVTANVAVVIADATCRSKVKADNLVVTGSLSLGADARSQAIGRTVTLVAAGGIVARAIVVFSYANGTVEAILASDGLLKLPGGMDIHVTYSAVSNAVITPPPISGGAINANVNVVLAKVKTRSNAGVEGTGTIDATGGDISIVNDGTVVSLANIQSALLEASGIGAAASFVYSDLNAEQNAYAKGVNIKANNVKVISR